MIVDGKEITLKALVAEADRAFGHCRKEAEHPNNVDFPSLYLYRHMIHMADGVEMLCSGPVVVATIPLLRSMLEALIALKYIHLKDHEKRSCAWLYDHLQQHTKLIEMVDPTTERGKEFQDTLAEEIPGLILSPFDSKEGLKTARTELAKPYMADVRNEVKRLQKESKKRKKNGTPRWYQMFHGVSNRYEMAKKVKLAGLYKLLYGPWSGTVHAMDPTSIISLQPDLTTEFKHLHDSKGLDFARVSAFQLLVMGTRTMLEYYDS